ncbi:MAG: ribonuclease [Verrucomicrobiota bacterium]|jgi:ribonuclease D
MLLEKFERQNVITSASQLGEFLPQIDSVDRVAIDTEADSLHCYREKLCLLQISVPNGDLLIDPLADVDLAPLCAVLERKEIVLHGADFDLRLLRRSLNFAARRTFDTVIAARLLGIREFSLAALIDRYFGVQLTKGSQKANWAQRPLSKRMVEYAVNDTHYLLPLAEKLEAELRERDRLEWFRQSCQRGLEQAAVERVRDLDEAWRISGAGALRGKAAVVLRALWQWREKEAEAADRPPFHILQNGELVASAEGFGQGDKPDYSHFSSRRRRAFHEAAEQALRSPPETWPLPRPRTGTRPSAEMRARAEELKRRRDRGAAQLELEPQFVAPRATLEALAANEASGASLLVPWQLELLGIPSSRGR